jgi:hypothetical protein
MVEEAQHALGLLEWLDQSVEKKPVKTSVSELNATLVMLAESVHENLQCGQIPGSLPHQRSPREPRDLPIDSDIKGGALG